ncbi:MAG: DUF4433 domain-containing protein, partial [Ignavibacteria bacterium]|nr:DUF4433 domain-containing protein [Ignavibacteria bacterium]
KMDNQKEELIEKLDGIVKYDLCHITHLKNVSSILKYGLYSRNYLKKHQGNYEDISDPEVQLRREFILHDFVPLFFSDNTPMLYVTYRKFGGQIALIEIDKKIILEEDFNIVISNGNLASTESKLEFFGANSSDNVDKLKFLESFGWYVWDIIYKRSPAYSKEWKRYRSSEVLVYERVPTKYFVSIHFSINYDDKYFQEIYELSKNNNIKIKTDLTENGCFERGVYKKF